MEGFSQRLKALRNDKGLTRRKLSELSGLHEVHLAKIERGERKRIEADTVIRLARALGCTTDCLLLGKEDPS